MEYYTEEELNAIINYYINLEITEDFPKDLIVMINEFNKLSDIQEMQEKSKEFRRYLLSKVSSDSLIPFINTLSSLWEYVSKPVQAEKFKDLVNSFEGDLYYLVKIWGETDGDVQLENIDFFDTLIANIIKGDRLDKLVRVWKSADPRIQLARKDIFISIIIDEICSKAEDPINGNSHLRSAWEATTEELQKELFAELFDHLKTNRSDLLTMWEVTKTEIQYEHYQDVIGALIQEVDELIEQEKNIKKQKEATSWGGYIIEPETEIIIDENISLLTKLFSHSSEEVQEKEIDYILEKTKIYGELIDDPFKQEELIRNIVELWSNTKSNVQTEKRFDTIIQMLGNEIEILYASILWGKTNKDIQEKKLSEMLEKYKENPECIKQIFSNTNIEINFSQSELTEIFKNIYPGKKDEYINSIVYNYIQLENINSELRKTINFDLLDPKVIENFGIDLIARMSNHEEIQQIFLENIYDKENIEIIKRLWQRTSNIKSLNSLLNNMKNYSGLLNGLNIDDLNQENIDNVIDFLLSADGKEEGFQSDWGIWDAWGDGFLEEKQTEGFKIADGDNIFGIKSVEQLMKFNLVKRDICNQILEGKTENLPVRILALTENDRKRLAILELAYGIDLNGARKIIEQFNFNSENIELTEEHKKILQRLNTIKAILETDDIDQLINIVGETKEKSQSFIEFQNDLIGMMENVYDNITYKTEEHGEDKFPSEIYIDEDGQPHEVEIFEIKDDFKLFARSEGAYNRDYMEPENYYDAINIPNTEYHRKLRKLNCTRFNCNSDT